MKIKCKKPKHQQPFNWLNLGQLKLPYFYFCNSVKNKKIKKIMLRINNYFELIKLFDYLEKNDGKKIALIGSLVLDTGFVNTFNLIGLYEPNFEEEEGELIHLINVPYEKNGNLYDNYFNDFHLFISHLERNCNSIKNLMLVAIVMD
jgi:hypothetical protein